MPSTVRQQFKKAMTRQGLAGVSAMLDAKTVASLSYMQVVRLLRALDVEMDKRKAVYRTAMGVAGREAEVTQADRAVQELVGVIRTVNAGIMANPDTRKGQDAQLEDVILDAHEDRARIWRKPQKNAHLHRQNLERRMDDAYDALVNKYPDFFRTHTALCEASDELLEKAGGRPLKGFWIQRLKFALFAPVKPLSQRIRVFSGTRENIGADGETIDEGLLRFRGDVVDALATQPSFIYRFLDEMGYDIRLGERLRDIDHDYLEENLAYGHESFEAYAAGVHRDETLEIDLPVYKCMAKNGAWLVSLAHDRGAELDLVIAHEAFHGIDRQMGYPSQSDGAYAHAYVRDRDHLRHAVLTEDEKGILAYYLPRDMGGLRRTVTGGRSETFAETGAEIALGVQDIQNSSITPYMESCADWSGKVVRSLRLMYALCPDGFATLTPEAVDRCLGRGRQPETRMWRAPALRAG